MWEKCGDEKKRWDFYTPPDKVNYKHQERKHKF